MQNLQGSRTRDAHHLRRLRDQLLQRRVPLAFDASRMRPILGALRWRTGTSRTPSIPTHDLLHFKIERFHLAERQAARPSRNLARLGDTRAHLA